MVLRGGYFESLAFVHLSKLLAHVLLHLSAQGTLVDALSKQNAMSINAALRSLWPLTIFMLVS